MSKGETYDNFINRILEITHENLVLLYHKERSAVQRLMYADTEAKRYDAMNDLDCASAKLNWLTEWIRDTLPKYRDIDADEIIKRTIEVAYVGDTE